MSSVRREGPRYVQTIKEMKKVNIDNLIPTNHRKKKKSKRSGDKGLKRYLRRLSERKGITYTEATLRFYNVKSLNKLDQKLVNSLFKD